MMYPFMTLDDGTEIVHSEMHADGRVKVYVERPDAAAGFHSRFQEVIQSTAHLILQC